MEALTVRPSARFPVPESVGPREWGTELLLLLVSGKFTLKLITMKRGAKGGLQYHRLKDEGGVMTKGAMLIRYDDGTGVLVERMVRAGDVFHFPPGCRHQAEAFTTCSYVEVSTPHFNDRVHAEHEYGINKEDGGLPSTELKDVVEA
jgi:mannose-6-phosphate isomerase-like protein (cupin superfamily)